MGDFLDTRFVSMREVLTYNAARGPFGPIASLERACAILLKRERMIDYLIHFYERGSEPFRSLSALPEEDALQMMRAMYREGAVFWERFQDPGHYLQMRRQTERWVRQDFIAKGGLPVDPYPIYLIFGRSKWMDTAIDEATIATTTEIHVPLALFEASEISFTYPDSMVSFMLASQKDPVYYLPEFHGKVFTLAEIRAIVAAYGLPSDTCGANLPRHLANYVEAQVWNHRPLLDYKRKLGFPV